MNIHVDIQKLCSLPVLRRKIGWENITEETWSDHGYSWPVFCVNPDTPGLPRIYLATSTEYDGIYQVNYGDDGLHFHMEGYSGDWEWRNTWKAVKMARGFVSGKMTVLEMIDGTGRMRGWEIQPAGYWPDTLFRSNCKRAKPGAKNAIVDASGNAWRPPRFRRSVFNREPFEDNPDWSGYVPVKCGWMTPRKRDEMRYLQLVTGELDYGGIV